MPRRLPHLSFFWALALTVLPCAAHPLPDIPVWTTFEQSGAFTIQVIVDPRCFAADPLMAPYLVNQDFQKLPESEKEALKAKVSDFIRNSVAFFFEPQGNFSPAFDYTFTTLEAAPLKKPEDPLMVSGVWRSTLPAGVTGYKVQSLPKARFSVVFNNVISGRKQDRFAVLFPGETSYALNLANLSGVADNAATERKPWPVFRVFFTEGFAHVLPGGWDHILFVLGLVLLCRRWRILVWQVSAFTVAHTLTLGLATFGWLRIPAETLEPPIVALSIATIAIENLLHPEYSRWRLAIVFVFGLVHGLGFAEGLRDLGVSGSSLGLELFSFNLGVEGGQLTAIALALAATAAIRSPRAYRSFVAVPASALIALIGLAWTFERLLTPQ